MTVSEKFHEHAGSSDTRVRVRQATSWPVFGIAVSFRTKFSAWVWAFVAMLGASFPGLAADADKDYPSKLTRIVVQYSPGGAPDFVARTLAAKLSESLGQQFIVENRAGASGNLATDFVAKSEPDGYTLLLASDGPIVINPSLFATLPFDPVRDLSPVTLASSTAFFLLVAPGVPANSVQELIAIAKANPGKLNFASSGNGSQHHLAGELFNKLAGIRLIHVPYKGFGAAVPDLISGKVEVMFGGVPPAIGFIKSGKLKALVVTSAKRYAGLPQVPTVMESGLPALEIYAWHGLMAPARTPRAVIDKLHSEVTKVLRSKDVTERFAAQGLDIIAAGPQEFAARIGTDARMWAQIIKDSGAKVD